MITLRDGALSTHCLRTETRQCRTVPGLVSILIFYRILIASSLVAPKTIAMIKRLSPFPSPCTHQPIDRHHKDKKLDPSSGSAVLNDPLGVLIRGDLVMKVSLVLTSHSKLEFAFTN